MKYAITVVARLAVLVLCVGFAQAQSFKETLRWMHQSSEYHSSFGPDGTWKAIEVPLTNTCANFVIIKKVWTGAHTRDTYTTLLHLSAVDPDTVRVTVSEDKSGIWVEVETTNDEDAIQVSSNRLSKSDTSGTFITFEDINFANRFAKALHHAVILCGGKPSTF